LDRYHASSASVNSSGSYESIAIMAELAPAIHVVQLK
jgi:hypothetical protein